jgi:AraC-like DNA-binding protein
MIKDPPVADGIRIEWACRVVNVCQAAFGDALDGDPTCLDTIVERLERSLPQPQNSAEALQLRQHLVILLFRIGNVLHDRFHIRFSPTPCASAPTTANEVLTLDPTASVSDLLRRWHGAYESWFMAHHRLPPALHAKRIIHDRFAEPLTTPALADHVGASRASLIQQFEAAFGLTPAEYLARFRIRQGLRLLRSTGGPVEQVANRVGYKSGNKFYARTRLYTGTTPAEARALSDADFDWMLDERLSLREDGRSD